VAPEGAGIGLNRSEEISMQHQVVSRAEWRKARGALIAKEKAHMRAGDALGVEQRALPWVKVDKNYVFVGPSGTLTLSDLFGGRSQLFVKLFMLAPGQTRQCTGCSLDVDHVGGLLEHLQANDVAYVVVAPAPLDEIETLRRRMEWRVPFVSGEEFYKEVFANFAPEGLTDTGGHLVFYKNDAGEIFQTYSSHGRGGEAFLGIYRYFDLMPKGRNESGPNHSMADWVRPRNMYGKGGTVSRNGQYHPPTCGCGTHAGAAGP
jgi:predicted dithiol-disulfide oxidoreductase (DUF899 family)